MSESGSDRQGGPLLSKVRRPCRRVGSPLGYLEISDKGGVQVTQRRWLAHPHGGRRLKNGQVVPGVGQLLWALEVCKIYANRQSLSNTPTYRADPGPGVRRPPYRGA